MTADGPTSDWAKDVVRFLSDNLYRETDEGWQHCFSSALQMGCEALIALGQADETDWGAARRECPKLPSTLPRWDDICIAVVGLARQQRKLTCYRPDGTNPLEGVGWTMYAPLGRTTPVPDPNISAIGALGPAKATQDVLPVLEALGLVSNEHWTGDAETMFWRSPPRAWRMDITSDPRFAEAVLRAVDTMPDDIRAEVERLTTITEEDVAASLALHMAAYKEFCDKRGPEARWAPPPTDEDARRREIAGRRDKLDWLFFRRWRLADGWLSEAQAKRALEIFHDTLAINVRCAFVERLYPDQPELQEYL